jgi:Tfp pilus assembly protein PilF
VAASSQRLADAASRLAASALQAFQGGDYARARQLIDKVALTDPSGPTDGRRSAPRGHR